MNKIWIPFAVMGMLLSGCLPAFSQADSSGPTPIPRENLEATAAVLVQMSLEALPTSTIAPSNTPVVIAATGTDTQVTQTATSDPALLTSVSTGTNADGTAANLGVGTLPFTMTPSVTPSGAIGVIVTDTPHAQHFGTLPPYLPFGKITIINKSKSNVYISLQCTTNDGFTTILEYPVSGTLDVKAPPGKVYLCCLGRRQKDRRQI